MNIERENILLDLRDKGNTASVKLPYVKSKESRSEVNSLYQPVSFHATGSTSATLKSGDGNDRTYTAVQIPDDIVPFEPLDEEGERYLREHLILPPIEELSGTKYYINIAPTESDLSSVNSVNEWWEFLDYDKECCVGSRGKEVKYNQQEHLKEVTVEEAINKKRNFPITKKTIMERQLNDHNAQEGIRAQVISDLEKQMVSLYNLKKQYKKNIYSEGCKKEPLSLPPIAGSDQLVRQRDSMMNRIRMKKKENDDKLRKQLDRKLEIVQKILKEQQQKRTTRSEVNKKYVVNQKSNEAKRPQNEYKKVQNNRADELEVEKQGQEHKINLSDTTVNIQDKESITVNILPNNVDFLNPGPEEKVISEEVELVPALNSSKKGATIKTKKKKNSLKGKNKEVSKKEKSKKKKIATEPAETAAATCEAAPEQPANEIPDLLLWFENWRETQQEETRQLKKIESKKLPVETKILLRPTSVTFKDVRASRVSRRQVTITNTGEEALRCRVINILYQPNYTQRSPVLKAELNGPNKATSGRSWTLTLSLEAIEEVEESKVEVRLEFRRADDTRSQLSVWANVLTPRAEPSISHSCLRFGSQVFWNEAAVTKFLTITNDGAQDCVVHWSKDRDSIHQLYRDSLTSSEDANSEVTHVAREVLETCFAEVFAVFRIDARQNQLLLSKSQVVLPVRFFPAMSEDKGDVFCKYTITFGGEKVINSEQDLLVCGKIEDTSFKLIPDMLDMKVCYIGGNVQQAEFYVVSSARHVCSVTTQVPRALAQQVFVVPKESMVQAHSSLCMVLRVVLRWSFLDDSSPYLDRESGLLNFPVLVTVHAGEGMVGPPLELRVLALVAPPCPLTLSPPGLGLGHVTTQDTVCSDLYITNHHHSCAYQFAFLDLPQSVVVEPAGGCGVLLPGETLPLQLLFSPSAQDIGVACGKPGGAGDVTLSLRCFTTTSLACPVLTQKKSRPSAIRSNDKSGPSTMKLSQIGDYGSGDIAYSSSSATRYDVGRFGDLPEVGSAGAVGGGGDYDDEPTVKESQTSSTFNEYAKGRVPSEDDSVSVKTNDVWDYFSSYQIESLKNSVELQQKTHKLFDDKSQNEQISITAHSDGITVTKITEEEGTNYYNTDENGHLSRNSRREEDEDIFLNQENQNESLLPLSKRNLELFEHGEDEYQPASDQRYASVSVHAYVTDPLVELSSQVVVLPPTPCQSYSAATIYIRSKFQKKCKVHESFTKFKTRFEFMCDNKELSVEPRCGWVQYNQSVKLTLLFKPVLKQREIFEKAFDMKMETMKMEKVRELLDLYYQLKDKKQKKMSTARSLKGSLTSKTKAKSKGTKSEGKSKNKAGPSKPKDKKRAKGSVVSTKTKKSKLSASSLKVKKKDSGALPDVVVDPAQVKVTDEDLREAEVWLLKYLESQTKHCTLVCTLDTTMNRGERRQESLVCRVVCPVVAPTLALCSSPCLQFGPTALGTSSRLTVCVTNVSFLDVLVHLSTLNPVGLLTCPFALEIPYSMNGEGLELPPEHTLNIPILFQPVASGKEVERFEVLSSSTVLHLQAKGEGVVPSFIFTPDQDVFTITYAANKKSDLIISVENSCEAPLRFSFRQEFLKEGHSLPSPTPNPSQPSSPEAGSKKTLKSKPDKKSKAKQEITTWTPELISSLEKEFTDLSIDAMREPCFKIIDYDKHINISPGEVKKITIRFIPQDDVKSRPNTASTKTLATKSSLKKSEVAGKRGKNLQKGKYSIKSEKEDRKGSSVSKSKKIKSDKKRNRSSAEHKEITTPSMKVIASKFTVLLQDIIEVRDWLLLGVIKK